MRLPLTIALVISGTWLMGCGGKPVQTKEQLTSTFAYAIIPASHAKGAAMNLYQSGIDQLPAPAITVKGAEHGQATLKVNPVALAVGLLGKGVMIDMKYEGFSDDGFHYLDGDVSALTQFDYQPDPANGDAPYADVKVSLVGQMGLSGILADALDMNVVLDTKFDEMRVDADHIQLNLNGTVDTPEKTFTWDHEDVEALLKAAAQQQQQ